MWCLQHGMGWSPFGIFYSTAWSKPETADWTSVTVQSKQAFITTLMKSVCFTIDLIIDLKLLLWSNLTSSLRITMRECCAHLVGALNAPHIGTLPSQIAFSAVIISVLLFQKLMEERKSLGCACHIPQLIKFQVRLSRVTGPSFFTLSYYKFTSNWSY